MVDAISDVVSRVIQEKRDEHPAFIPSPAVLDAIRKIVQEELKRLPQPIPSPDCLPCANVVQYIPQPATLCVGADVIVLDDSHTGQAW